MKMKTKYQLGIVSVLALGIGIYAGARYGTTDPLSYVDCYQRSHAGSMPFHQCEEALIEKACGKDNTQTEYFDCLWEQTLEKELGEKLWRKSRTDLGEK